MAQRNALVVGTGVADRIAAGLTGSFSVSRTVTDQPLDLVVWADYPALACQPRPLVDFTSGQWEAACDNPLRSAIDLARQVHPQLAATQGTMVFLVPLMASAGGAGYTALSTVGEGVRILAKSLAKTWGADCITAHAVTLDPHAFLDHELAAGIAEANSLHDPPYGRVPDDTSEVAPIIEWLASTQAAPLTGASLVVDGGLWMPG
jgi:NAD(P)-dependent dehydrogenase (short-subunit alcohol dehydrogenase family)